MKSNPIQSVCSTGDGASPRASLWIRRESSSSSTSRRRLSFLRSRPRRARVCRRRVRVCRRRRRRRRRRYRTTTMSNLSLSDDPPIEFAGRDRSISSITGPVPSAGRPIGGSTERAGKRTETGLVRWVDRGGCVKPYGFFFIMRFHKCSGTS